MKHWTDPFSFPPFHSLGPTPFHSRDSDIPVCAFRLPEGPVGFGKQY